MSLPKDTWTMPLASGLQTKADPRALEAPGLAECKNAIFDEVGGIQKRYPLTNIGTNILGGGTIADIRRAFDFGDELLVFTETGLYSWSVHDTAWVLKGTHLAIKVSEKPVFVTQEEQLTADRAELGNCVVYAWAVDEGASTQVYAAAVDKVTGNVIMAPAIPGDGGGGVTATSRPRLVALASVFLLFFIDSSGNLAVSALDPDALEVETTPTTVFADADVATAYDVVTNTAGTVAYVAGAGQGGTDYELASVTAALSVATTNKARPCDGPIAIAAAPNGTHVQIVRGDSTNIEGDYLTIAGPFTDVTVNQALGAGTGTINQIAAAYRSVTTGGEYRCYAFWSSSETSSSTSFLCEYNYVDTGGTIGTETTLARRLGVVSRAFDHDGSVYVWVAFAGESSFSGTIPSTVRAQLQNTYFLYRDDGTFHAKAVTHKSGGFSGGTGHLPNVQSLGSNQYAWMGIERRVIPLGGVKKSGYAGHAPREVKFTFDSNEARRCARLGDTLYITGGEILQYDGVGLYEVGFHIYPWYFGSIEVPAGSVADGTYTLKPTWRWDNAKFERDRSTSATSGTITIAAGPNGISTTTWAPLQVTHKTNITGEMWRSLVDPNGGDPFYLATSQDPTATTNPNRYIENDSTAATNATFNDEFADATLATKETFSENDGELESLAPPPATIIAATQDRLFLAGIADAPHRIVYSKLRAPGEVAAFHEALSVELPPSGGVITALAFLNETLVAFKETAIYALPGDGFGNLGEGQNYGPARLLSSDVGAQSAEAVALAPQGLIFKSDKGWYLLSRGWGVEYIGDPVARFDSDTVAAVHVVEHKHQIRCLSSSARLLVLDYHVRSEASPLGQWSEWTVTDGLHACIWRGTYHVIATGAVRAEQTTYTGVDYSLDVETAWIKLGGMMGFQRIWYLQVLGEYRSAHDLRVRIARDYSDSDASGPTWVDDKYWSPSSTTVGGRLQVRHGVQSPQQCEAIKIRLTDYADGSTTNPPAGEALKLTGIALEVGVKRGAYKQLVAAAKQ